MVEKLLPLTAAFLMGVLVTLHLAMGAAAGKIIGSAKASNFLFWIIGAVAAGLIWLTGAHRGSLANFGQVPVHLWSAGAIGATLVFGIAALMPRLGAAPMMIILVVAEIAAAVVISHFGTLGSPQSSLTVAKAVGLLLLFLGAALAIR